MTDFDGSIWFAQDNDEIHPICIVKRAKNKLQALNEKGRELKLSEEKLLWQHTKSLNEQTHWSETVAGIQSQVERLATTIDMSLLWESATEMGITEMDDLADLYFGGEIHPEHLAAIWYSLAQDKIYFKRKGKIWEPRTQAQITELQTQRRKEQQKAWEFSIASDWLQTAIKAKKALIVTESIVPFVEKLENWLRGDAEKIVNELIPPLAEQLRIKPRELVLNILQKLGKVAEDADRDVIVAGLKPEFPPAVQEVAENMACWLPPESHEITPLAFSIDDEETREVDDALAIERDGEHWKITIAIADPECVVKRGDVLDREAMRRGTTVYLPTQTVLMLPERISCDIASLSAGQARSSIVLKAWLNEQGQLQNSKISRESIQVQHRLSYSEADKLMEEAQNEIGQQLKALSEVSQKLHAQRMTEGAFTLQRPEYKLSIDENKKISVIMIDRHSPSRSLVAEMMILANHIAAKYAQQHQVPIIYRAQEPPLEDITEEVADPIQFMRIRKSLRPSTLSLEAGAHSGLGLSVYTQLTSPLRRFADLVMQRQLVAHVVGESQPYDHQELYKVLEMAERTAKAAKQVENEAKRRWFLKYLEDNRAMTINSVVLEPVKNIGYKVEMQPWGVDAFLGASKRLEIGDIVATMVDKIRISMGNVKLKLVD